MLPPGERAISRARKVEPPHFVRPGAPADRASVVALRPFSAMPPQALLIGASTGGPHALATLVGALGGAVDRFAGSDHPAHAATFTSILAEHLARASGRPAREARGRRSGQPRHDSDRAGRPPHAGGARDDRPGDRSRRRSADQFLQAGDRSVVLIAAESGAARHSRSCSPAWASTEPAAPPMSSPRRGSVIAQDETTSVVWGMPGSVAHAGLCSAVLPIDLIAPTIIRLFPGERQ